MIDLTEALRPHSRIGLDTPVLIYQIEANAVFSDAAAQVLDQLRQATATGVVSILAILELQVRPLQLGRRGLAGRYEAIVRSIPNLTVVDIDARVARSAARLKATHGVRTVDALHIASCLLHGATAFVTNDARLRRVTEIRPIILTDHVAP